VYVDAMVLRDRDADGNSATGPGGLEERVYALQDGNWNTTALIAGSVSGRTAGDLIQRFTYTPFGEVILLTPGLAEQVTPLEVSWQHLFQGLKFTDATGLAYARNRDYSAILGRWIILDSEVESSWVKLYVMEDNSPMGYVDPLGRAATVAAEDLGESTLGDNDYIKEATAYSTEAANQAKDSVGLTMAHREGTKVTASWNAKSPCCCTFTLHISSMSKTIIKRDAMWWTGNELNISKIHEGGHREQNVAVAKKYASQLTSPGTCCYFYAVGEIYIRPAFQTQNSCDEYAKILTTYLVSQLEKYQHEVAEVLHETKGSKYLSTSTLEGNKEAVKAANAYIPTMKMVDWECSDTLKPRP
jgi:RHS repeat-associated protein